MAITLKTAAVVDDDPFMVALVSSYLETLGLETIDVYNDPTGFMPALESQDKLPELIMLDINMPNMDGIEMLRYLQQHDYPGYIIIMSGENDLVLESGEKIIKSRGLNYLGRLDKPFVKGHIARLFENLEIAVPKPHRIAEVQQVSVDEFQEALATNQFINLYQPKISFRTGRIESVEALVYWEHPQRGLLSPFHFIEFAEQNALITDLTMQVLANATNDYDHWREIGIDTISVNLSLLDLEDEGFCDRVMSLLEDRQISPSNITLEITETAILQNPTPILDNFSRLLLRKFKISIDDFGTGHASISQLKDFPYTELKIDRSFVHGAHANDMKKAIINSSISLAKALDLNVVVEGIEEIEDWQYFRQLECGQAQGYLFSRPITNQALLELASDWDNRMKTFF